MKDTIITYESDTKGVNGQFTYPMPELEDFAAMLHLPELAESPVLADLYWGWYRQVLVTFRAQAKRLRAGSKTKPAMREGEVAQFMKTVPLPKYDQPSEQMSDVQKIEVMLKRLTPEQRAVLAALVKE